MSYQTYIELLIRDFRTKAGAIHSEIDDSIMQIFLNDKQWCRAIDSIDQTLKEKSMKILTPVEVKYRTDNMVCNKAVSTTLKIIDPQNIESENITIEKIEGIEAIGGMTCSAETLMIHGVPQNSGDFLLILYGVLNSSKGYLQNIKGSLTVTVNPDPKTLWKEIEPDPELPYVKPHTDLDFKVSDDKDRLFYASKRGRSHAHAGTFRDDDGKIATTTSKWSILVVADGGGSYKLSRRGSKVIVEQTVDALQKILLGEEAEALEKLVIENHQNPNEHSKQQLLSQFNKTIISAIYTAYHKLSQEANEKKNDIKSYSTTLLLALHKLHENGKHIIISFWVGDGVIALYQKNKSVTLLGKPDNGEFAGQTRFLDENAYQNTDRVDFVVVDDFTALILATDGVSDPFFHHEKALESLESWDHFWTTELWSVLNKESDKESSEALLEWLDFWAIGNHDDRTIAILSPACNQKNVLKYPLINATKEEDKYD